ncbi:hypothetical protein BJ508DRAFT_311812 [Ascobolus immersus RN42]|uniref:Uncharacterized protein n=1 Tax=Ascobolus immersus RN42 TaxID=1160509 RepID=A0A3N4HP56_ASCIM|nr:hypothetical protein BJ508DRAFT_311812 [Ascobolus immersus RN42]
MPWPTDYVELAEYERHQRMGRRGNRDLKLLPGLESIPKTDQLLRGGSFISYILHNPFLDSILLLSADQRLPPIELLCTEGDDVRFDFDRLMIIKIRIYFTKWCRLAEQDFRAGNRWDIRNNCLLIETELLIERWDHPIVERTVRVGFPRAFDSRDVEITHVYLADWSDARRSYIDVTRRTRRNGV